MRLQVIAVGHKLPDWINTGIADYQKRFPAHLSLDITPIAPAHRAKHHPASHTMAQEGQKICAQIPEKAYCIALAVNGKAMSTPKLADQMRDWMAGGQDICFLIGGADGLSPECYARANAQISLSQLTLPHPIARLVLVEQLYRAYTIIQNHPYHRE